MFNRILYSFLFCSILFSCKKNNSSTSNNSSNSSHSNWTFKNINYFQDRTYNDVCKWNDATSFSYPSLSCSGDDGTMANMSEIVVKFKNRPTINKIYGVSESVTDSTCSIHLNIINPVDGFGWYGSKSTDKLNVQVNNGKISISFNDLTMCEQTFTSVLYSNLTGTIIED